MVIPSLPQFWKLLADSGLVSADRLADLRGRFSQMRGITNANATLLAEWLIAEQALTRYQADILLRGRSGPFAYGDFVVYERLMKGRLAGCFRAIHRPTCHPVLLTFFGGKVPCDAAHWAGAVATGMQSFQFEAPYMSQCYELVDLGTYKFAVLEDLPGRSVADTVAGGKRMPVTEAFSVACCTALALETLHKAGHTHGDVRPENLWLATEGRAILLHFPLTRTSYTQRAPLDVIAADYAAPEVDPADPMPTAASDIYALGCSLYEMLAGRPPFGGGDLTVQQKMLRHAREPIEPLHSSGDIPEVVNQVVSYMMAKNVAVRYRDATTVAEALCPFTDPARVSPTPPPSATRAVYRGVAQRRRGAIAGASVQAATAPPAVAIGNPPAPSSAPTPTGIASAAASPGGNLTAGGPSLDGLFDSDSTAKVTPGASPTGGGGKSTDDEETSRWKRLTRSRVFLAVGGVVLLGLLLLLGFAVFGPEGTEKQDTAKTGTKQDGGDSKSDETGGKDPNEMLDNGDSDTRPGSGAVAAAGGEPYEDIIPDDGSTLWASPTQGQPPDLRFIPTGAQMIFMIRASQLFDASGDFDLAKAMGPAGEQFGSWVQTQTGFGLSEIERLDIALFPLDAGRLPYCLVVRTSERIATDRLLARWSNPPKATYQGDTYYRTGQLAYYIPKNTSVTFAAGTVEQMHDVIDTLGEAAWLAPPMEKLRLTADAQRQINVLFLPNFLRSGGDVLYPGRLGPLHEVVSWLLGPSDDVQAGLVSCHVGKDFFAELRLHCMRHKKPEVMAHEIHDRLGGAGNAISRHLASLAVSPYGRQVLAGLPGMLESLHRYTRYDRNKPNGYQAVLRCYLPVGTAQNFAVATDLILLESADPGTAPPAAGAAQ